MKKPYIPVFCSLLVFVFTILFSAGVYSKKRCKPLLNKLHNIQALQRQGYSLKRGQNLRTQEDQARDKWWQCEHSSLAKFNAKYGKSKKLAKRKPSNSAIESSRTKAKKNKSNKISTSYISMNEVTFNQTSAIVIKSKYQGDKNIAWLEFYQKPSKCQQPKSLTVFAYCCENKLEQQNRFEQAYAK